MSPEQKLIQDLYTEKAVDASNARSLAQLLRSVINDTLSGDKYLNELLQNADDSESPCVEFILCGQYLIFKHKGKHFEEKDVRAICDVASPFRDKSADLNKIGNKGIGFKAVFSLASAVTIISHNYCFRFDESYDVWKEKPDEYPWQIIPILTDKTAYPDSVKQHCDDTSVHFIFQVRPQLLPEMMTHLNKLQASKLLFLRHTKEMKVVGNGGETIIGKLYAPTLFNSDEKNTYTVNKVATAENTGWYVYSTRCQLPATLRSKFERATNIPGKYEKCDDLPISIAICYHNGKLLSVPQVPQVFCYLPTEMNFGFKFVVNGEFLLDSSRMQLRADSLADAWNGFILESMFRESVQFLNVLARNALEWSSVLDMLSPPQTNLLPARLTNNFSEVFKQAIVKFPLVRNLNSNGVYSLAGIMLDPYDFISRFGTDKMQGNCINPRMSSKEILPYFGAQTFSYDKIIQCLKEAWLLEKIKDPQKNKEFIELIARIYNNISGEIKSSQDLKALQKEISTLFKTRTFILSSRGNLFPIEAIHFPNEQLKYAVSGFTFFELVHAVLEASANVKSLLSTLGLTMLDLKKIIALANNGKDELVNFTLQLAMSQRLFRESQKLKEETDLIKTLKVKNRKGEIVTATSCYLPDLLNPSVLMEQFMSADSQLFLLQGYAPSNTQQQLILRDFFIRMGVQQTIDFNNVAMIVNAVNDSNDPDKLIRFTQWIFKSFYQRKNESEKNALLVTLKSLKVVNANNAIVIAQTCYLPNQYSPAQSLETVLPLPNLQLSSAYIENAADFKEWSIFFLSLGVRDKLAVTLDEKLYVEKYKPEEQNDGIFRAYYEYSKEFKKKQGKVLFAARTMSGYFYQHYFSNYVRFEFAEHIYKTPIFWQLLKIHWAQLGNLGETRYHTGISQEDIPSTVHFLAEKSIMHHYGAEKKMADFYGNAVKKKLMPYIQHCQLDIAEITEDLELEQVRVLGFKMTLNWSDCLIILEKIREANHYHEDFDKIVFVYQSMFEHISQVESAGNITLPNQHGVFLPAKELLYIVDNLLPYSENEYLIKRPKTFSAQDFQKLCDFWGVKTIGFKDLEIVPTGEILDSGLRNSLNEKLIYIVCMEAFQHDLFGVSNQTGRVELKNKFQEKLEKLTYTCAREIKVKYGDKLADNVDVWIVKEKCHIYHRPHDVLDHQEQQELYEFLREHLELTFLLHDFRSIMTSSPDQIEKKYQKRLNAFSTQSFSAENIGVEERLGALALSSVKVAIAAVSDGTDEHSVVNNNNSYTPFSQSYAPRTQGNYFASSSASGSGNAVNAESAVDGKKTGENDKKRIPSQENSETHGLFSNENFTKMQLYAIGYCGEVAVYHKLQDKHTQKYGAGKITPTDKGYTIDRSARGKGKKTLTWLNRRPPELPITEDNYKIYEGGLPYDFEVKISKEDQETIRCLEVKTSIKSDSDFEFSCSTAEWEKITANDGRSHRLFTVKARIENNRPIADSDSIQKKKLAEEVKEGKWHVADFKRIKLKK